MTPENSPHNPERVSESDESIDTPYDNAKVEQSYPDLPPYAYIPNGGIPYPYGIPNNNQPAAGGLPPFQAYGYPYYPPIPNYQATSTKNTVPRTTFPEGVFPGNAFPENTPIGSQLITPHENKDHSATESQQEEAEIFDYTFITSPARVAIYDSLKTAPRVIEIEGAPTHEYIERIASITYKSAKEEGGIIPYTVIREVSENFIHARFQEIVVSIMDKGNTIRFADQGPGISNKDLVQEPGFSSATEPMKRYIRGVGSGLPIVRDYLDTTHGYIEIEDNINKGSVVTISLVASRSIHDTPPELEIPELTENEERILKALLPDKTLGITEINRETGIAVASIHTALTKMESKGLVEKVNKKRKLTILGERVAISL